MKSERGMLKRRGVIFGFARDVKADQLFGRGTHASVKSS